jgi:hypothetical protein
LRFAGNAALATELNNAQCRLRHANDRLGPGLHPDGMEVLHGECPAAVGVVVANDRSEVLSAADPLPQAKEVRWTIHQAFLDYQAAPEPRRQLAAEVGELAGQLIATFVAARWSEQDARAANVHNLAHTGQDAPSECRLDGGRRCQSTHRMPRDDHGRAAHN